MNRFSFCAVAGIILQIAAVTHNAASAAEQVFGPFTIDSSKPGDIAMRGPITEGAALDFRRALRAAPDARQIILDSEGGDVQAGLLIADDIHQRALATYIPPESGCYSACSYVFLAGNERKVEGKLGVHQISSTSPDLVRAQLAISDIIEVLGRFDTSPEVMQVMLKTPPDAMHVFNPDEVERYRLNRVNGAATAKSNGTSKSWSKEAVDKAIAPIVASEEEGSGPCVRSGGTTIAYEVKQIDINGDGVNEIEVAASPAELGNGASSCYGHVGQNIYLLISAGRDKWDQAFGFDAVALEYLPRGSGQMPDVQIGGPGFCFPIWRFYKGSYGIWKTCRDGKLVFADQAQDVSSPIVPSNFGEQPVVMQTEPAKISVKARLPEFDHNGSLMLVDHERGLIAYKTPKKSIRGTIAPGTILFKGTAWDQYETGRIIKGTAYLFKKGCAPAPYQVSGSLVNSWHTLVLRGAAPVRKKGSCVVESYSLNSPNAELRFESLVD